MPMITGNCEYTLVILFLHLILAPINCQLSSPLKHYFYQVMLPLNFIFILSQKKNYTESRTPCKSKNYSDALSTILNDKIAESFIPEQKDSIKLTFCFQFLQCCTLLGKTIDSTNCQPPTTLLEMGFYGQVVSNYRNTAKTIALKYDSSL